MCFIIYFLGVNLIQLLSWQYIIIKLFTDTCECSCGTYYSASTYEKYPIETITDNTLPLTSIGKIFASTGLNVVSFNYIFARHLPNTTNSCCGWLIFVVLKKEF